MVKTQTGNLINTIATDIQFFISNFQIFHSHLQNKNGYSTHTYLELMVAFWLVSS